MHISSLCLFACIVWNRDTGEAMQWLLTAFPPSPATSSSSSPAPAPYCQPSDLTYSMLLTAAAADKHSWEVVFYILAEMRLRGNTHTHTRSLILSIRHTPLRYFIPSSTYHLLLNITFIATTQLLDMPLSRRALETLIRLLVIARPLHTLSQPTLLNTPLYLTLRLSPSP